MIYKITVATLFVFFLIGASNCQTASETTSDAKPVYDSELARRVGADEHGMRNYVLAILMTGPNDSKVTGERRSKIFEGHFANIKRLADEGSLAIAGPFDDPKNKYRGLFIFAVPTVDAAKALGDSDPAVKAGIFVVEYVPWFASAALMLTNELHPKVAAKSFGTE